MYEICCGLFVSLLMLRYGVADSLFEKQTRQVGCGDKSAGYKLVLVADADTIDRPFRS